MHSLLAKYYGFQPAQVKKLVGYASSNYKVEASEQTFVLKGYRHNPKLISQLKAENELLSFLNKQAPGRFPQPIQNQKGDWITEIAKGKDTGVYRMLSFLQGKFLAEVTHTPELFASFGSFLAHMDKHLMVFNHLAIEARCTSWDLQHLVISQSWQEPDLQPLRS